MALDSRGRYIPEKVIPKNSSEANMDSTMRKLLFPSDPRGTQGILARGKPFYKGGLPSPTNPNMDPRTGKVAGSPYQRLALMRLKGLI